MGRGLGVLFVLISGLWRVASCRVVPRDYARVTDGVEITCAQGLYKLLRSSL